MLIRQIKLYSLTARKARETDKATLLTTLYSEASMIGKNDGNRETTDAEVVQIVKKFIKGVDENLDRLSKEDENNTNSLGLAVANNKFESEKKWLSKFLPKQLTEEVLKIEIHSIMVDKDITDMKGMSIVMKTLKERFDGMYDGYLASKIVRETLA